MRQTLYQVDAFTDTPFRGNPAAVCILERELPETQMQQLAAEMNLSETAFLLERGDGYLLRWFTPEVEVELCGHATLASAHVLWEAEYADPERVLHFHTRSGKLSASRLGDMIEIDLPADAPEPASAPPALLEALGAEPTWAGRGRANYMLELDAEKSVRDLRPDFGRLRSASEGSLGIIVTSRSESPEFDFVSRYFAPAAGVDEDPVTGSAHCSLGPYWSDRLGKKTLRAYQASRRGGTLRVRVAGERVYLAGKAVTVMRGELLI